MAAYSNPLIADNGLAAVKANCNKMVLCSQQPTSFTEANSTYALASVAMAPADFTLANGDTTGGRKVTSAAKTGIVPAVSGTANHACWIDTVNSVLYYAQPLATAIALTAGQGTVDISAFKDEIRAVA